MLELNIISPQLKKEIKQKFIYSNIKNIVYILFFFCTLYIILFLILKIILQIHFIDTINQTNVLTKNVENYSLKVSQINHNITDTKGIQADYTKWSEMLFFLENIRPTDVAYNKILVNKTNNNLQIKGYSATRDSLLRFKESLENSGNFTKFDLPIQSLLKETGIDFDISLSITSYEFN